MSPDPFIRDAVFRGSPILSYGTANRGSAWPKFLALAAGIFVLLAIAVLSWFWFFTNIPIPKNTIVLAILPSRTSLGVNAPLVWKQAITLNSPSPTIAGIAKVANEISTTAYTNLSYAIRLSPATAIIGRTRLWDLSSEEKLTEYDYKSPFEVFGWPWEMFDGRLLLQVAVKDLFADADFTAADLPNVVEGEVIGNKWQTNIPIMRVSDAGEQSELLLQTDGFVTLDEGANEFLRNFLIYYGAWLDYTEQGTLTWEFATSTVDVDYMGFGDEEIATYDDLAALKVVPYTLEDGTVVQRLFKNSQQSSSTVDRATSTTLAIPISQREIYGNENSVSALTCQGQVMAKFDRQSLRNFCSWFDICYFNFDHVVFLNEMGYLTICGY